MSACQTNHQTYQAVLLAAGVGKRFDASGQRHKLLQTLAGAGASQTVLAASLTQVCGAISEVLVVLADGPHLAELQAQCAAFPVRTVINPAAASGMASSIVCAIQHSADAAGWLIAPADMPFISSAIWRQQCQHLAAGHSLAQAQYRGQRGHPVAFAACFRDDLLQLGRDPAQADQGARAILSSHPCHFWDTDEPGILVDIDTPADLLAW